MNNNNQKGNIDLILILVGVFFSIFLILALLSVSFKGSNERVSGVVYNTTNDTFIAGNTRFSIRAAENTFVSEENKSSYCLPPNSEYIDLINRAAENKDIKVVVRAEKYFAIKAPWTCYNNVVVEEVK